MRDTKDDKLRLGKGATVFVKCQLKRLRQEDETWEADFRALPKPITQSVTHYLGLVLVPPHGDLLAMFEIEQAPTVNDLAKLLADAMRRPLALGSHRLRRIHVRGNPRWKELSLHLKEVGIEVVVQKILPQVDDAYNEFVREIKKARSANKIKPTEEQIGVEKVFPAIAKWVKSYGHIEIGDQVGFGFVVRALDYGGIVFDDDRPSTLAEVMAALEKGLAEWFEQEGIGLEWHCSGTVPNTKSLRHILLSSLSVSTKPS
jgi:hypothetical protein